MLLDGRPDAFGVFGGVDPGGHDPFAPGGSAALDAIDVHDEFAEGVLVGIGPFLASGAVVELRDLVARMVGPLPGDAARKTAAVANWLMAMWSGWP